MSLFNEAHKIPWCVYRLGEVDRASRPLSQLFEVGRRVIDSFRSQISLAKSSNRVSLLSFSIRISAMAAIMWRLSSCTPRHNNVISYDRLQSTDRVKPFKFKKGEGIEGGSTIFAVTLGVTVSV